MTLAIVRKYGEDIRDPSVDGKNQRNQAKAHAVNVRIATTSDDEAVKAALASWVTELQSECGSCTSFDKIELTLKNCVRRLRLSDSKVAQIVNKWQQFTVMLTPYCSEAIRRSNLPHLSLSCFDPATYGPVTATLRTRRQIL